MADHHDRDRVDSAALNADLANILRARRESLGWPLQRMAKRTGGVLDEHTLQRVEAGVEPPRSSEAVRALATSYDMDVAQLYAPHQPVEVGTDHVAVGDVKVEWYSTHIDDVLVAYLELLRLLRGEVEGPVVNFRRVDVDALATALDYPPEAIVGRLAILIGAKGLRRAALAGSYNAGNPVISTGYAEDSPPSIEVGPADGRLASLGDST